MLDLPNAKGVMQLMEPSPAPATHSRRRFVKYSAGTLLLIGLLWAVYGVLQRRQPMGPVEIFAGVTYTCERIADRKEASGLCHLVRVDLRAPGIQLYATPLDPQAVGQGNQYRLETAESVTRRERLAVCINGVLFSSPSRWLRRSGELAKGSEMVIADHTASQTDNENFLIWFDRELKPHAEPQRSPRPEALRDAQWGISGQVLVLRGGVPTKHGDQLVDRQTMLGIDESKRLLWLAVFESASSNAAAEVLAQHGVQAAIRLDGGDSATMVIGEGARDIASGAVLSSWRASATFFGVRADELPEK